MTKILKSEQTAWVVELAQRFLPVEPRCQPLPSERDLNYRVWDTVGKSYVLKLSSQHDEFAAIAFQIDALTRLPKSPWQFPIHQPLADGSGYCLDCIAPGGLAHRARLVEYCRGEPWATKRPGFEHWFDELGAMLGWLDCQWANGSCGRFPDRGAFIWDLARGTDVIRERFDCISDAGEREWINEVLQRHQTYCVPHLPSLRQSIIHNDANDYNVLVGPSVGGVGPWYVTGLIDFGDLVFSHTVNELAIAIAYAVLGVHDAPAAARRIAAAYHGQFPLRDVEVESLWGLTLLRLAVSLVNSRFSERRNPDHAYLRISQQPILRALPQLLSYPHRWVTASLRDACGLPAASRATSVVHWLKENRGALRPVIADADQSWGSPAHIDLSVDSDLLRGDPSAFAFQTNDLVDAELRTASASWGIGFYDEPRLVYASDQFLSSSNPYRSAAAQRFDERRTIHLGLDLFAAAGTAIAAPIDATIFAAAAIDRPLDYGGVIILQHATDDGSHFYSLYGHLSRDSAHRAVVGRSLRAGEVFAHLGSAAENGGWAPHLHLQLIVDELGLRCDFPGVCRASERAVWTSLSPDPMLLVPLLEGSVSQPPKPTSAELEARRRLRMPTVMRTSYRRPLPLVRGWRQHLFDVDGRRFLDAYNNVPHVGHCHPDVVGAVERQLRLLNTNSRYLSAVAIEYADRLVAKCPRPLEVCFLLNSASEANELAVRLARQFTGAEDFVVLEAGYHGWTSTLVELSHYKHAGRGGAGTPDWVQVLPLPDDYRGRFRRGTAEIAQSYAADVEGALRRIEAAGKRPCAFLAETCPSVAGQLMLPDGYLRRVYQSIRAAGGLTIADEVQTGLGRLGSHFFAFEGHGVVPDILVLGKPMANGLPLAALITTREIADRFDNGMEFFSTFGGNQVSAAAGLAVLDVLEREQLQKHALSVGDYLAQGFAALQARHPLVGDVRGSGLFWGLELVRDGSSLQPADAEAEYLVEFLRERGILMGRDGPHRNVLKIRPPMPFDTSDAQSLLDVLEESLDVLKATPLAAATADFA